MNYLLINYLLMILINKFLINKFLINTTHSLHAHQEQRTRHPRSFFPPDGRGPNARPRPPPPLTTPLSCLAPPRSRGRGGTNRSRAGVSNGAAAGRGRQRGGGHAGGAGLHRGCGAPGGARYRGESPPGESPGAPITAWGGSGRPRSQLLEAAWGLR